MLGGKKPELIRQRDNALRELDRLRSELAAKDARIAELDAAHERARGLSRDLTTCLENRNRELAALRTAGEELHKCLAAMVNRWEPDTEGLDRVMWENACEALGRNIWAHLRTT